jgi:AcrR family transcriptional regulator
MTVVEQPRSARREATRQRILDAARVVFAEKGVFGASIEDICEQAGFTRGAVYSNFTDKDDILRAVIEREQETLVAGITESFSIVDEEIAAGQTLEQAVAAIVNRMLRSLPIERQFILIATELELHAVRRPELAGLFVDATRTFRARLADALVEAMRRVGREPLVDPIDIIDGVMAIGQESFRAALIAGPEADPYRVPEAILPGMLVALSRPRAGARRTVSRPRPSQARCPRSILL